MDEDMPVFTFKVDVQAPDMDSARAVMVAWVRRLQIDPPIELPVHLQPFEYEITWHYG